MLLSIGAWCGDCDMPLRIVIPSQAENLTNSEKQLVRNKLRNIITQNGIVGGSDASPFAIAAYVDVIDEEVVSGSPVKYVYILNVNLYIVDTQDEKIYSSASVEVRTVGNSKEKAYVNGIRQLSASAPEVQTCIENGKNKMLAYYNDNYKNIIKTARTQASLKNFEEAIFYLMSVPVCSKGYDAAVAELSTIYQQYIDRLGEENLALAQAAWMAGYSKENAAAAAEYLALIDPDAACYSDAQKLVKEIKAHLGEEWKFELKQWDDTVDVQKQMLKNSREIALDYAKNLPDSITSIIF